MATKFLGETGLLTLWKKIASTFVAFVSGTKTIKVRQVMQYSDGVMLGGTTAIDGNEENDPLSRNRGTYTLMKSGSGRMVHNIDYGDYATSAANGILRVAGFGVTDNGVVRVQHAKNLWIGASAVGNSFDAVLPVNAAGIDKTNPYLYVDYDEIYMKYGAACVSVEEDKVKLYLSEERHFYLQNGDWLYTATRYVSIRHGRFVYEGNYLRLDEKVALNYCATNVFEATDEATRIRYDSNHLIKVSSDGTTVYGGLTGDTFTTTTLNVSGAASLGSLVVSGTSTLSSLSVDGASTFTGTVTTNGNLKINGSTEVRGGFTVFTQLTLENGASILGSVNLNSGNFNIAYGSLTVGQASASGSGGAVIYGGTTLYGGTTIHDGLNVNGTLGVTGSTKVSEQLSVDGAFVANSTATIAGTLTAQSGASIGGDATIGGNASVGGHLDIGDVRLSYDETNGALKISKKDGTAGNVYATGGITAYGAGNNTDALTALTAKVDQIIDILEENGCM